MENQLDQDFKDEIRRRMLRIEKKVDTLLEFKWKVIGGTIAASLILTFLTQLFFGLRL